ncbi:flagellar hook protein FlgE [Shumkonia mesophila]|uniref:flagellar hook protein FlgE n=1 Tax=Shumkonia mesophila TaxID=2838854 RepID=UPI0029347145|nr:flagellar hook protein FlgE [Shumkonia mesophila]
MSLSSAMFTAVSSLKAQSRALSVISNNLANSGTTGYKTVTTSFSSLVTQMYNGTNYPGAGVTSSARQHVANQGKIEGTAKTTDIALDGNGMFLVRRGTGDDSLYFSRNGEFQQDNEGYLVNNNYYLLGWPTDSTGKVVSTQSSAALERINVTKNISSIQPSSAATVKADLGPSTAIGGKSTSSMEVYDALGNLHTVTSTWEKTATNTWTLGFSCPDGTSSLGATPLNFDGTGKLTSPSPANITLPFNWTNGAAASSIVIDLTNVTQTNKSVGVDQVSATTNGHTTGKLLGVSISNDGAVTATYDNGESLPIYRVAVATFANYDGLSALSHGIYQKSRDSGDYSLHTAGAGGSATVKGSSLESSTVDTADDFSRMIVAQQAYSASSQVIKSAKDMYDTLLSAVR